MPGKRLALLFWLFLAAPAAAAGQLEVRTEPPGAHVYLDNRHAGLSPVVIEAPAGAHRLTTQLRGHEPAAREVTIVDGLTRRTVVTLRPLGAGELRLVTGPSGAEVYLDGRRLGVTPLTARGLQPGRHALVVVRRGHQRLSRTIEIHDGLTTRLELALSPIARPVPAPKQAPAVPPPPAAPRREAAAPPAAPIEAARPEPAKAAPAVAPTPGAAPVAPAAPTQVFPALAGAPAAPAPASDPRTWVFSGLLALLALGLAAYARRVGRAREPLQWHPPAAARGPRPWPGPEAPGPEAAMAIALMSQGRFEAARLSLLQALATSPGGDWHYYHLGLACQEAGRWAEAEGAYRTALQLALGHPDAGYNLGVLHAGLDQLPQAVMAYRRHLDEHPEDVDALFNLGCAYFTLGMHAQARTHWAAARSLQPRHAAVRANIRLLSRLGKARPARQAS